MLLDTLCKMANAMYYRAFSVCYYCHNHN